MPETETKPPYSALLRRARGQAMADPPEDYVCPITQEVFTDPVLAQDEHNYERAALDDWLQRTPRSPVTNLPLQPGAYVPNGPLRRQIAAWREQQQFSIPAHLLTIDENNLLGTGAYGQVRWARS